MRRNLVALVIGASCVSAACASAAPADAVRLVTGVDPGTCYLGGEQGSTGELLADDTYGTTFNGQPVMWPDGYTGRRVGAEVEVLDAFGTVRATTGRRYHISFAPVNASEAVELMDRINAYPAAVECDFPHDFVDCATSPVAADYCEPGAIRGPLMPPEVHASPLL